MNRMFQTLVLCAAVLWMTVGPVAADISRDFNTAMHFYKKGEYDEAAQRFELILSRSGAIARGDEVTFLLGESYYHLGKYADALGLYKRFAAEFPESKFATRASLSAGYASKKLGRFKDAIGFFSQVSEDPAAKGLEVESRLALADCFSQAGDARRAESILRDVLAMPKLPSDQRQDAGLALGFLLVRAGNLPDGRAELLRVAEKSGPRQAEALIALADLAYDEGKYQESIQWYEKIFAKGRSVSRETRAEALYGGAWAYIGMGETEKARALFSEVFEDKTAAAGLRSDAALQLAHLHRDKGNRQAADNMAKAAEQLAQESGRADRADEILLFRADSAFLQKNFDQAMVFLARISNKDYRVVRLTGRIFFETGRRLDAVDYFERAALAAPTHAALNLCLFDMALGLHSAGQFDTAVATLDRIKEPNDDLVPRLKPFLADALLAAGKSKDAAKLFGLLASESTDTRAGQRYRYFTALAHFQDKNYSKANKVLESFFETASKIKMDAATDTTAAAAMVLRADILAALGKNDEARDAYKRAITAAKQVDADALFLAYSHLIDFSAKYSGRNLIEYIDAFAADLGDVRAYAFIFDRLYAAENYKNLLRYANAMSGKFPSDAEIYGKTLFYKTLAHFKLRDIPAARDALDRLSRWLTDRPAPDLADDVDFWRARILQGSGESLNAKTAFRSYLDLHSSGKYAAEARFHLGVMAVEESRPDDAELEFGKLLSGKSLKDILSSPFLSDAQYNMASVRILQSRFLEAEVILEPLSALKSFKSDPAFLYKLGYVKVTLAKWPAAEQLYREVLAKPAAPPQTMDNSIYGLFSLLYRRERYGELESEFRRLAGRIRDPVISSKANFLMGMALFDAERFDEAGLYFEDISPSADTELLIESSLRRADCEYNLKRFKSALDRYTRIAETHAATGWGREAAYAAGLCKIKLGFAESALSGFERFLQQNPEDPLAIDVAMEAARLYQNRGDLDAAERKLDFLEKRKVERTVAEEMMRLRVRIAKKREDSDMVLTLARSHRAAYGPNPEIALAAADAAVKLRRPQEAIGALEGFGAKDIDSVVRANFDFYRAEALSQLGDRSAVELYKRLIDFPDDEIRLAARFRYGNHLMDQKEYARAREILVSILDAPNGKSAPFFQEALINVFAAAKSAGEPPEIARLYDKFKKNISGRQNQIAAAEYNLWARLALKDDDKSQDAIYDLLAMDVPARRRTEVLLTSAKLHESMDNPDRADAIYTSILNNRDAGADLREQAESRKVKLAVSRGARGLPILEEYLQRGATGEWALRAADALLDAAAQDKRHLDVIRIADLIEHTLGISKNAARYVSALSRLALSDTHAALGDFHKIADGSSSETFYVAWSSYRIAQDAVPKKLWLEARPYLQAAWKGRENLSDAAARTVYHQLTQTLFELGDDRALKTFAADPLPPGVSAGAPNLLKGILAFQAEDYSAANRHLKPFAPTSDQIRMLYARSLAIHGDTVSAYDEYDKLADGNGPLAGTAQFRAADLLESAGRVPEGLIAYYKVLAMHESDTQSDLAAEALFRISSLYAKTGNLKKSKEAAAELLAKFPNSPVAREARALAVGENIHEPNN